ncbi:MAG: RNA 2',3'-cyclic phosphodiesterase [Candidatus Cloacimonetes bacterium]|nr:RNA 2',3'-cyclic phosphodiesterase [Candidatus Cloacimonadota bacterium]
MRYRSFIALETPEKPKRSLERALERFRPHPGVNWVKDENLHLTLLFLGDVDVNRIGELSEVLSESCANAAAFSLTIRGLEIFPYKSPRLVWATLADAEGSLANWHKKLLGKIRHAGFEPDSKPLKPHITLGRIKKAIPPALQNEILTAKVEPGFFPYDRVTLFRSILHGDGPIYQALESFELKP